MAIPTEPTDLSVLIPTEQINPDTQGIDLCETQAVLAQINQADQSVAIAVQAIIPSMVPVVDAVIRAIQNQGRLLYVGAGTSGRLGVLDAAECVPTFGTSPHQVQGIIAGGFPALTASIEGAEDDGLAGQKAMMDVQVGSSDVVIGISASGGAAFVVEAIKHARKLGAVTGSITCVATSALAKSSEYPMVVTVGPEVIAGSSRMKAGTAQKLMLNMISTAAMVGIGKTYRNLMVDVRPTNQKLRQRATRLVSLLAKVDSHTAQTMLENANWEVKTAVVCLVQSCSVDHGRAQLAAHSGKLRAVLESIQD